MIKRNPEDLLTVEKSFQTGTGILYTNCSKIDSTLLPLIYYKNAMKGDYNAEGKILH